MRRFYAHKEKILEGKIILSAEEAHHLFSVDRFREGDTVLVFNGEGSEYEAVISDKKNGCAVLEIKRQIKKEENRYALRVAVCLPKRGKFENIIEKCTELNVDEIIPLISNRTIVRIGQSKMEGKLRRWQKKAAESSKQANRAKFPRIKTACKLSEFISTLTGESLVLIPTLYSNSNLREALGNIKSYRDIVVLIGPEGDFDLEEVKMAEDKGAVPVSLGETVLRVETAVIFAVSVINYELYG